MPIEIEPPVLELGKPDAPRNRDDDIRVVVVGTGCDRTLDSIRALLAAHRSGAAPLVTVVTEEQAVGTGRDRTLDSIRALLDGHHSGATPFVTDEEPRILGPRRSLRSTVTTLANQLALQAAFQESAASLQLHAPEVPNKPWYQKHAKRGRHRVY